MIEDEMEEDAEEEDAAEEGVAVVAMVAVMAVAMVEEAVAEVEEEDVVVKEDEVAEVSTSWMNRRSPHSEANEHIYSKMHTHSSLGYLLSNLPLVGVPA